MSIFRRYFFWLFCNFNLFKQTVDLLKKIHTSSQDTNRHWVTPESLDLKNKQWDLLLCCILGSPFPHFSPLIARQNEMRDLPHLSGGAETLGEALPMFFSNSLDNTNTHSACVMWVSVLFCSEGHSRTQRINKWCNQSTVHLVKK